MWPLSTPARLALAGSHRVTARATAYTAPYGAVTVPISSGSVTVDATSQVRRSATCGIPDAALWPANPLDILSPFGTELAIDYGIGLGAGRIEWVPLLRGPITDAHRTRPPSTGDSAITVSVADRSSQVAEARFSQPTQTIPGATVVAEITRLIQDVLPDVTVTDLTDSPQIAAQLDIERERWADGIEKLADSIGAEVFADPLGEFVIRPTPQLRSDRVVWVASTGDGGALVSIDETLTRENVYNRVVASGQRTDGTPPVWAVVDDDDPASPTRVGGPFGTKPRFYSSPLLTTTQQCTDTARSLLARATGIQATVALSIVTNPALDAGDIVAVQDSAATSLHILDSVGIPLSVTDTQQLSTRSLTELPAES